MGTVIFDGVAYGMLLFLIGVGLSITMGLMNFVNLAHGSFAMVGGYAASVLMNRWGIGFAPSLAAAFIAAALSGALRGLMVNVERYPDLKASQNFLALQEELSSTENKISFARQAYNDSVTRYNSRIQTIPSNLVAGPTGFFKRELFELTDATERAAPQVKF